MKGPVTRQKEQRVVSGCAKRARKKIPSRNKQLMKYIRTSAALGSFLKSGWRCLLPYSIEETLLVGKTEMK